MTTKHFAGIGLARALKKPRSGKPVELAAGESESERLKREERALRDRIDTFGAADRLSREHVHERRS